ncbi:unnamed protein product [Calypogeia fissa]
MGDKGGVGKTISVQDWEQIMQDFRTSSDLQQKWLTIWPGLTLVEQALIIILKREFPIKAQLLVFMEENAEILVGSEGSEVKVGLGMILESLRGVLQSAGDGVIITSAIRENMMVMATTVAIVTDALHNAREKLEGLVELFIVFINRPNHPSDRHLRGLACDSLRELEMAYPCLLYGCVGHIHFLCRQEKTHVNQSYTLLLTTIMENLSTRMYTIRSKSANYLPILQNTAPLIPFSAPFFLVSSTPGKEIQALPKRDLTPGNLREFRTVVAFLLERPHLLSTVGMLELVSSIIEISKAIDLSGATLKTHFSGILHSYSPVLCHIVLIIYTRFMDSMDGEEGTILRRLVALPKEDSQSLPFRLLGVHWLLGIETLHLKEQNLSVIAPYASELYPLVFDPLSLKAAKLGALAYCAFALDQRGKASQGNVVNINGSGDSPSVLLNEGLLSVSSYQWLPPWSNETQLAFHIFHRFLTVTIPHPPRSTAHVSNQVGFKDSQLFETLQSIFVTMAAKMWKLVPNMVALLDRLMGCATHRPLAERLLRTFNQELLPQLQPNRRLSSYFPLLERIAENGEIPPGALIDKLTFYVMQRVEKDEDSDEDWVLWSRSTQVLGICRTILLHYQSSRVFHTLAPLLGFLCCFFPDIEVRDTARLYLRMLISIPGNKLRSILKYGDERVDEANAPQVSSLLQSPAPSLKDNKNPLSGTSYVRLMRITPLLIRHSWSMVLFDAFQATNRPQDGSIDKSPGKGRAGKTKTKKNAETEAETGTIQKAEDDEEVNINPYQTNPSLRVLDTRTSEIILVLRKHFAEVPDFVNGAGLKIRVPCTLKYYGEYPDRLGADSESGDSPTLSSSFSSVSDSWPAIYGCVITLKTSGFYGPIPKVRVPFLLSEPPHKTRERSVEGSSVNISEDQDAQNIDRKGKYYLENAPRSAGAWPNATADNTRPQTDSSGSEGPLFGHLVTIELEPKQPVPTLVDVHIEYSDEQGHGVQGQLDSIPVSIEDLFTKPPVPSDLSPVDRIEYLLKLFDAMWEACSGPGRLGTETFLLKDALEVVSMVGAESVKLLEAQADRVVAAVEQYLAPYVVAVDGSALSTMAKDGGAFKEVKWLVEEVNSSSGSDVLSGPQLGSPLTKSMNNEGSLQIQLRDPGFSSMDDVSRNLGSFLVLVLLPPCYHLLLRMEVADESTLVRIRTDYWPCLAHVDEYLEALTVSS